MRISSAGNLCSMVLFVPIVFLCGGNPWLYGRKASVRTYSVHPSVTLRISEADTDSGEA